MARARFSAWTDADAVTALAASCHVRPREKDGLPEEGERDALSCALPWSQSCAYDPCFEKLQACHEGCGKTCGGCDSACMDTCDTCKASCKDDACRAACAAKTGACKQGCLQEVDHCATGECAKAEHACYAEEKRAWIARKCSCKKIAPCTNACMEGLTRCGENCPDDFFRKCTDKCRAKWNGCDVTYCIMGTDPVPTP